MASDITLSSAVRNNLLSLQKTAQLLGATQERLATGLKVNSALDDPTAFFTASSLNDRASDLSRLQDFVGNAVQTLAAADEGITAITNLVEAAEGTARQALQSASTIATFTGNNTTALTSATDLSDLNAVFSGSQTISFSTAAAEVTTLTLDANSTVGDIITAINDNTAVTDATAVDNVNGTVSTNAGGGAHIRAALTADGKIKLEATDGTGTIDVTFTNDSNGVEANFESAVAALGFTANGGSGDSGATGSTADYSITQVAAGSASTDRTSLATQFDELRTQIDQLALDSSFNGVNLLDGDSLTVIFNEDSTSFLALAGVTFSSTGLAITTSDNNFQTDYDIRAALDELDSAINTLRAQASTFGSNLSVVEARQDFTKELVNVLETGAANLTLADTNEEGANLLALQTRQQLSSTALSLASQADQNVLRLFG